MFTDCFGHLVWSTRTHRASLKVLDIAACQNIDSNVNEFIANHQP